jgi:hypothetical protein
MVWNGIYDVDSGYGADEEVGGAGGGVPPVWFRDYMIEIYNSAGTSRRRTDFSEEPYYEYTFTRNCEDSTDGVPVNSFEIRVRARDYMGNVSTVPAKMVVSNDNPKDITGLAAIPVVGGVEFSWDRNMEEDFRCYNIRTQIGTSGWSGWIDTEDCYYIRILTVAEITAEGAMPTIYIEIKAKDWYGNTSRNAVTANCKAHYISDNLFQLVGAKGSGITGTVSELYDGDYDSGGVVVA